MYVVIYQFRVEHQADISEARKMVEGLTGCIRG